MRQCICLLMVCLLAAGCGAPLVAQPNATNRAAAEVSTRIPPTDTPFVLPTPPPPALPLCPDAPRPRLILNERARVLPDDPRPINLRGGPGTDNNTITSIPILEIFFVLNGPVCKGNYAWYEVQYGVYQGWVAEGDLSSYYVEPYLPE
ncbi:MAG: SH3 domain-containing protein [Chloroflexota bacterium]